MVEAGGDPDLAEEALARERLGELRPTDLDRDVPVVLEVVREVDGRHPARAKLAVDPVTVGECGLQMVHSYRWRDFTWETDSKVYHARDVCSARTLAGVFDSGYNRRYFTHVPTHHTPRSISLSRPDSRVPIRSVNGRAIHLDGESCTQGRDCNVRTDATDVKLLGIVRTKPNDAGRVGCEILRLCAELPVRPGEQQVIGDQVVHRGNIRGKLRGADSLLERDDLGIVVSTQGALH